jgi:hypothetical protein
MSSPIDSRSLSGSMKRKPEKTAAAIRRANRGNVPGVLGMEEMAMLSAAPHLGVCPSCARKTWERFMLGRRCFLDDCAGIIQAVQP